MHETERDDEHVEEDEGEEEHAPSTLVDHPVVELLHGRAGHEGGDRARGGGGGALEALEAAALGLVALEVGGLVAIDDDVGVLLERGDLAVREIHAGLPPSVEGHNLVPGAGESVGRGQEQSRRPAQKRACLL